MNLEKHIWEGWQVKDFISELEVVVDMIMTNNSWIKPFTNKKELKEWCIDNQPYYKKYIPEVVDYFAKQYQIS
jgi:hypothetical protein